MRINLILSFVFVLLTFEAKGETIISLNSIGEEGYGCLVIYNGQGYRVGWTQTDAYDSVVVSAKLGSGGATNETARAYLTTQIGAGTSVTNEIASASFVFPVQPANVVLFQGLHLPAGTYYLSIIGNSLTWGSCWASGFGTNVITGSGVSSLGGFGAAGALDPYFPASPAYADKPTPQDFDVQGVNVNHPVLQIAKSGNFIQIYWSTNSVGFNLQTANSLTSTNWQATGAPIEISGSFVFVTNVVGTQFYRLSKQTN